MADHFLVELVGCHGAGCFDPVTTRITTPGGRVVYGCQKHRLRWLDFISRHSDVPIKTPHDLEAEASA